MIFSKDKLTINEIHIEVDDAHGAHGAQWPFEVCSWHWRSRCCSCDECGLDHARSLGLELALEFDHKKRREEENRAPHLHNR